MQGTESEEKLRQLNCSRDVCIQRRGRAGGRELGSAFFVMKFSLGLLLSHPQKLC